MCWVSWELNAWLTVTHLVRFAISIGCCQLAFPEKDWVRRTNLNKVAEQCLVPQLNGVRRY